MPMMCVRIPSNGESCVIHRYMSMRHVVETGSTLEIPDYGLCVQYRGDPTMSSSSKCQWWHTVDLTNYTLNDYFAIQQRIESHKNLLHDLKYSHCSLAKGKEDYQEQPQNLLNSEKDLQHNLEKNQECSENCIQMQKKHSLCWSVHVALGCVALRWIALGCVGLRWVALRCVGLDCVALVCVVIIQNIMKLLYN
jgi:hypothetical protein